MRYSLALLLPALIGCDRWQQMDPTVLVSAEVAALYSAEHPGLVLIEHEQYDQTRAVGALCGVEGDVTFTSEYFLIGCAEPHRARALAAPMVEFDCDEDFATSGPRLSHPEDLVLDAIGEWVEVYTNPGDDEGCFAKESSSYVTFELGL